jgi:hypothetical protein
MKEYFQKQLDKCEPLTEKMIKKLNGKPLYGEYKEGDKVVIFLEEVIDPIEEDKISIIVRMTVDREFDKVKEDFSYIRNAYKFPILERKKK